MVISVTFLRFVGICYLIVMHRQYRMVFCKSNVRRYQAFLVIGMLIGEVTIVVLINYDDSSA